MHQTGVLHTFPFVYGLCCTEEILSKKESRIEEVVVANKKLNHQLIKARKESFDLKEELSFRNMNSINISNLDTTCKDL